MLVGSLLNPDLLHNWLSLWLALHTAAGQTDAKHRGWFLDYTEHDTGGKGDKAKW